MRSIAGLFGFISVLLVISISASHAEDKQHNPNQMDVSGVESLTPELRKLLNKEMQALQKGMMSIIPAYASGNWKEIEHIASKMEHSYILKQNISKEQIEELHSTLPESFIKLDQQFHYFAGMLSHVAKNRKQELIGFYFYKLNESCVICHSQYATHRFRGFIEKEEIDRHAH